MARPKTIVLKSDDLKRFGPEVFDLVRTKLAPAVGGNVNFGVKLAADYFAPRKPGEVNAVEMGEAIPQIVAKFEADVKAESESRHGGSGRLPLNGEAQKLWDSEEWKGRLTLQGLRERFKAEIKDNVDLTVSMINAYVGELAAEKAAIAKLVDEQPDPDSSGPVKCVFVGHRGDDRQFQPSIAFKLFRNDAEQLERQKHNQGDEYIRVGHFLVLKDEKEEVTGEMAAYCSPCRAAARDLARNAVDENGEKAPVKLTFYTWAGAQRVISAAKSRSETDAAAMKQIRAAGARTFGGRGQGKTWKTDRQWKGGRARIAR